MEQSAENDAAPEWRTEWAVEVTWRDWKKAGAKGPTSQYGPFGNEGWRDRFLADQRKDRDIAATRVLTRRAAYTPWVGPEAPETTTEEEREALLAAEYERIMGRVIPPVVPCAVCEHTHTPDGCVGPPSPSDLWAGVSPSVCDCDTPIPPAETGGS